MDVHIISQTEENGNVNCSIAICQEMTCMQKNMVISQEIIKKHNDLDLEQIATKALTFLTGKNLTLEELGSTIVLGEYIQKYNDFELK